METDQLPVDEQTNGPGVSHIDPHDPAAPMYEVLARMRTPVALREIMILPVRRGYIGQDNPTPPANLPPSGAELFPNVIVTQLFVPSSAGPVRCGVYHPGTPQAQAALPIIVYVHGGGFMVGTSDDTDFLTRKLSTQNHAVVVSVNYRLAPEFPFPAGLDDCIAVYRWLLEHGAEVGGDPARVAVAGDSSGGNFAAAIALRACREGPRAPRAAILLGPVCDIRYEQYASFERLAPTGIVYDTAFMGFARGAYVPRYSDWSHPYVSPIGGDLRGYPPTFIAAGTEDPMIDSCRAFAQKLETTGSTDVEIFAPIGMPHGFYFFPGIFREEEEAYTRIAAFLKKHL